MKVKYCIELGAVIQLNKIPEKLGNIVIFSEKTNSELEVTKTFFYRRCCKYHGNHNEIIKKYLNRA